MGPKFRRREVLVILITTPTGRIGSRVLIRLLESEIQHRPWVAGACGLVVSRVPDARRDLANGNRLAGVERTVFMENLLGQRELKDCRDNVNGVLPGLGSDTRLGRAVVRFGVVHVT